MRNSLGAPLVYSREKNGYHYEGDYEIPMLFSAGEPDDYSSNGYDRRELLLLAIRAIESRRVLRMRVENVFSFVHPYEIDYKNRSITGYSEDTGGIVTVPLESIEAMALSNRPFISKPGLFRRNSDMKRVVLEIKGIETEFFYGNSAELSFLLLSEDEVRVIGPETAIRDVLDVIESLKTLIGLTM